MTATASHERPIRILLVEDSPGDANLTREALRGARVANELVVVTDGEAAMDYLRRRGAYADVTGVDLVLLDLNLPKKDGREVLAEIKSDPALKRLPVIVLTTSSHERDVLASYDLHANAYVTKPVAFTEFIDALARLEGFWLQVVRLPTDD
jgi:two-component system, chemotaxis family, response regulator Rcp1